MLFNKVLGENEKHVVVVVFFLLKTKLLGQTNKPIVMIQLQNSSLSPAEILYPYVTFY